MNFESKTELEARKAEKRKARELLLNEAKKKYDIEENKIAAAKARGEDKWMLPELSQHIDKQAKKLKKKSKKMKKEKKKKHDKKSKKEKRKASSSSESEASGDEQWIEKSKKVEEKVKPAQDGISDSVPAVVKGPVLQRDNWMTLDSVDIPTVSRQQLREKIKEDKLQYADPKNQPQVNIEEPGTHEKELNPYWKSGSGKGLPEEEKPGVVVPKHNLNFLKQAYARCEKQAEETGESLESLAAERYGSLAQLEVMIMEAERAEELAKEAKDHPSTKVESKYHRGRQDRHGGGQRSNMTDSNRNRNRSRSRDRNRMKNRSRSRERYSRRSRSRSRNRRSRSRSRNRRSRSRSRNRRNRLRSRDRYSRRSRSKSRAGNRIRSDDRTQKRNRRSPTRSGSNSSSDGSSSDRSEERRKAKNSVSSSSQHKRFMKPGEMVHEVPAAGKPKRAFLKPGESLDSSGPRPSSTTEPNRPCWKKPGYKGDVESSKDQPAKATKTDRTPPPGDVSSSMSSSDRDSSSDSSEDEPEQKVPVALTDDEMNALGAKILKAELMGNDEMAKELKGKLEASRQARAAGVTPAAADDKEKVVMLSHADKFGNVRPVQSQDADAAKEGGKRRRARKAPTHNKSGERERYFADDDRFNIKDMVQAEKMTSAEDHHLMFSKMAAKVTEKIDDDNQIDDAMINRARLEHDPSKEAAKQQQQAHADSKRLAQTLDNCQYCLENMTKHLIVAVYRNTYLCLPEHQSLTEGHCRIIPIHHCMSSTSCDENIWNEVQEFRKALVKMFAANEDQDCVFMECSSNLRRHPHMVLECVPIERELGDLAPIYFKKAIDESEKEWAQNKKLVDLSRKDIRHSVPKGFPYFAVDFGLQGGFAHVIEDERNFPAYFGKEVVGGMMDVDPRLWRKPRKELFEDQRKKVINFAKMWKPFDFTSQKSESDSDSN